MKRAAVTGATGFIGAALVKRLKADGYWVRGFDRKHCEFGETECDSLILKDLRELVLGDHLFDEIDEVYHLAAEMGGMGFIGDPTNDARIMHDNTRMNLNILETCRIRKIPKVFFSSSACVYPDHHAWTPVDDGCREAIAYPADCDSDYGWEKLYAERLYQAYARSYGMQVRIARYHNIYGPEGTWRGGREKAPAAICRKVAEADKGVSIWGDGKQTRSFLYIDDCIEATRRLMDSDFEGPVNIGSSEMVSINDLVAMVFEISGRRPRMWGHEEGPQGVRGRNSDNTLIQEKLDWLPKFSLREGLERTYPWIASQVKQARRDEAEEVRRRVSAGP